MDLQGKRALLIAQKDQQMANLNATLGAIAIVDELIAEEAVERAAETSRQLGEAAAAIAAERVEPTAAQLHAETVEQVKVDMAATYCTMSGPTFCDEAASRCSDCPQKAVPIAPEMLPVQSEEIVPCAECRSVNACRRGGCDLAK